MKVPTSQEGRKILCAQRTWYQERVYMERSALLWRLAGRLSGFDVAVLAL